MWKFFVVLALIMISVNVSGTDCSELNKFPKMNTSPRYFIHFNVCSNAKPSNLLSVLIIVGYMNQNRACNIVTNRFEGATGSRSFEDQYRIRVKHGCVNRVIPLDKFVLGICNWQSTDFYYEIHDKENRVKYLNFDRSIVDSQNQASKLLDDWQVYGGKSILVKNKTNDFPRLIYRHASHLEYTIKIDVVKNGGKK